MAQFSRELTEGEKSLIRNVYGNTVNVEDIHIVDGTYSPLINRTMTPDGNMYSQHAIYSNDYSRSSPGLQQIFIHEMEHVQQYQQGTNVIVAGAALHTVYAFNDRAAYQLANIDENTDWNSLNIEQKAVLTQDYFAKIYNQPMIQPPPNDVPLGVYQAIIPFAVLPPPPAGETLPKPRPADLCFLAGTPVTMADGSEKPIEEIRIGDEVMSFDPKEDSGMGKLVPRRVTRLFRNSTDEIVDLRGLKMTPGHVVLSDNGEWLPIADVLRQDRCIVEQRDGQAVLVRARSGVAKGSMMDTPIRIVYEDPATGLNRVIRARADIPGLYSLKDNRWFSTAFVMTQNGNSIADDGRIVSKGRVTDMIDWPEGTTPFDHAIQRDFILEDAGGRAFMPEWVAAIGSGAKAVNAGPQPSPAMAGSFAQRPAATNRKERRKQTALRRVK